MRFFRKRAKKGEKMFKNGKKGKMFENLGKNVQNLKNIFDIGQMFPCNYWTQ